MRDSELVRKAAALIHEEAEEFGGKPDEFFPSVGDWLDEAADHLFEHEERSRSQLAPPEYVCPTALEGPDCSVLGQAVTVAKAYLKHQVF